MGSLHARPHYIVPPNGVARIVRLTACGCEDDHTFLRRTRVPWGRIFMRRRLAWVPLQFFLCRARPKSAYGFCKQIRGRRPASPIQIRCGWIRQRRRYGGVWRGRSATLAWSVLDLCRRPRHGTRFHRCRRTSINHVGVYGQVEENTFVPSVFHAGVLGAASTQPGVIGFSENNDGVQGRSFNGGGVLGNSLFGSGVSGRSGSHSSSGVRGVAENQGPPPGMGIPAAAGVLGTASDAPGVIGTSNALIGVYGFSTANAGVVGESVNSFAGFFAGNVVVTGTLTAGVKNAAVRFPDGSQRVLHCMESPEHWFEDFGAGKLKGGRATVKLDADFAKVIKRGDYHVFLTPRGDCRGLYVRSQ